MSDFKNPAIIIPALLLLLVASIQVYNVKVKNLTQWKGGGFGMFSTTDSGGSRRLRVTAIDTDGTEYRIDWTAFEREGVAYRQMPNDRTANTFIAALSKEEYAVNATWGDSQLSFVERSRTRPLAGRIETLVEARVHSMENRTKGGLVLGPIKENTRFEPKELRLIRISVSAVDFDGENGLLALRELHEKARYFTEAAH